MRILKHGEPAKKVEDPRQKTYRFECKNCGCVYEAEGTECTVIPEITLIQEGIFREDLTFRVKCPNCKIWVYGESK